jgi:PIN domain nuclease of toxin-antitoxin system
LKTWLIDTALFATLGPASSQKSGLRYWLDAHREPVFLSAASLVEIEAAIGRVPASQLARINALGNWLDGLLSAFGDRIHPADAAIAIRAGRLLPSCNQGHVRHRFHDAVLVATAQACGHGLLSKRVTVFGAWTKVALASP